MFNSLKAKVDVGYWTQLFIALLGIIYCFTFTSFHLNQAIYPVQFLNIQLPFPNGILLYVFLAIGVCIASIGRFYSKQNYYMSSFDGLMIFYILYNVVSLYWVKDWGHGFVAIANAIAWYFFYYLTTDLLEKNETLTLKFLKYFLYILSFLFVVAYFLNNYELLINGINSNESYQRVITTTKSWIGGKNQTACFLILLIPLILFFRKGNVTLILLAIVLLNILVMGSRNAYVGIILFGLLYSILDKKKIKKLLILILVLILFSILIFVVGEFDFIIDHLKSNTWSSRFLLWKQTFAMGSDHWLFGVGAGQWDLYRLKYDIWFTYIHPHNDFVRNFAELGIIGCFLYYSIFAMFLINSFKNLNFKNRVSVIAIATIISYLSLSFFDEMKMKINYNILLGLFFALTNYTWLQKVPKKLNSKFVGLCLKSFLIASASFLIVYSFKLHTANTHIDKYRTYMSMSEKDLAISELNKIDKRVISNIGQTSINSLIARIYFDIGKLDSAILHYTKLVKTQPYYFKKVEGNVLLAIANNKKNKAWRELTKLFLIDPCSPIFENTKIDVLPTKKSKYYQNIIEEQQAKCKALK